MDALARALELFGRMHPLVLHLPIGLLVGLGVLELLSRWSRIETNPRFVSILVWFAALSALVSAASGYVLSREGGYGSPLENHKRLGIAIASATMLAALLHERARRRESPGAEKAYRAFLFLAVILLFPAGHLGSQMTHGEDWLTEPFQRELAETVSESPPDQASRGPDYATVAPIFAARCTTCHGSVKHKGGLRLHEAALVLAGSDDGPVIVPGVPAKSEMVRRLRLPLEHEDHMPPEGRAQPGEDEIAKIEAWIAAGALIGGDAALDSTEETEESSEKLGGPPPADPLALAALEQALVHAERIGSDTNLWSVSFAATAPQTADAEALRLLEPLLEQVAELSLARSAVTDATLALAARMPHLRRLDLRATAVSDAGVAELKGHESLAELVLAQAKLTDAAIEHLLALPALAKLNVWNTGLSPDAIARLRAERPALAIEAGDALTTETLEVEPEVQLTSDRPIPGEDAKSASALEPVNDLCPVSEKPVDRSYAIVFRGRVIGFCCPNCPQEFWANPAEYEVKVR